MNHAQCETPLRACRLRVCVAPIRAVAYYLLASAASAVAVSACTKTGAAPVPTNERALGARDAVLTNRGSTAVTALAVEGGSETHVKNALRGQPVEGEFTFQPLLQANVAIRDVVPSCGCAIASLRRIGAGGGATDYVFNDTLGPDERLVLRYVIDTTRSKLGSNSVHFDVLDSFDGRIRCTIDYLTAAPAAFEPRELQFGTLSRNANVSRRTRLTVYGVDKPVVDLAPHVASSYFTIESVVPVPPTEEPNLTAWDITVRTTPPLPFASRIMERIPLIVRGTTVGDTVLGEHREAIFTVCAYGVARVVDGLFATPDVIAFGALEPGSVTERRADISQNSGLCEALSESVLELEWDPVGTWIQSGLSARLDWDAHGDGSLSVTCTMPANPAGAVFRGSILLRPPTECDLAPIKVPFFGMVRSGGAGATATR